MDDNSFIKLAQNYVNKHHKTKLPQEKEDLIYETITFILENNITSLADLEKIFAKEIKAYLREKVLKFRREETVGENSDGQGGDFDDDRSDDDILSVKSRKADSSDSEMFREEVEIQHHRVNKVIYSNTSLESEKYYNEYKTTRQLKYKQFLPPILFEAYERTYFSHLAETQFTKGFETSSLQVLAKRARMRILFKELEEM